MFRELLAAEFLPYGGLSEVQLRLLEDHYLLLSQWNQQLNLTRMKDLAEVVRFHYCESLFLGRQLPSGAYRIADVGSGAGFPGIPVAVLRPECQVTLIESHQRKAVFLREASRNLSNVRVVSKRAEEVGDKFDWLISRAVSPDDVLGLDLAPRVGLLIGRADASRLHGSIEPVPWGNQRVLFHVERQP
jgi:16S rRNA G527 N7-methylase RsmG